MGLDRGPSFLGAIGLLTLLPSFPWTVAFGLTMIVWSNWTGFARLRGSATAA